MNTNIIYYHEYFGNGDALLPKKFAEDNPLYDTVCP